MLKKRTTSSNASNSVVVKKDKIILYGNTYEYRIIKTKDYRWGEPSHILYIRFGKKPFVPMVHQATYISDTTLIYQAKNYYFKYIKK